MKDSSLSLAEWVVRPTSSGLPSGNSDVCMDKRLGTAYASLTSLQSPTSRQSLCICALNLLRLLDVLRENFKRYFLEKAVFF